MLLTACHQSCLAQLAANSWVGMLIVRVQNLDRLAMLFQNFPRVRASFTSCDIRRAHLFGSEVAAALDAAIIFAHGLIVLHPHPPPQRQILTLAHIPARAHRDMTSVFVQGLGTQIKLPDTAMIAHVWGPLQHLAKLLMNGRPVLYCTS